MSDDPYFEVKAEVEAALAQLSSTHAQLGRASPNSEERSWALAELKATLAAVVPDLEELEESVAALEEVGVARRLGIADKEVRARRDFVERARGEIAAIRRQLPDSRADSPDAKRKRYSASSSAYPPSYHTNAPEQSGTDGESDPNAEFEIQHQTLLMEQQDRTLTDISGTVGLLREQAHLMGREVFEQNRMIEELDEHVDSTAGRLSRAQARMDRFVRENSASHSTSNWCIFILMIVLSTLLLVILFA